MPDLSYINVDGALNVARAIIAGSGFIQKGIFPALTEASEGNPYRLGLAIERVSRAIEPDGTGDARVIALWQRAPGRTLDDVLEVFDRA